MSRDLRDVLSEDISTFVPESTPEELDERFAKENHALLSAVFKVNVEVVLFDCLTVWSKLVLNLLDKAPLSRDLRRFDQNVESHLRTLFLQNLFGNFQDLPEEQS